jgi:enoyl-[acyl-carrier protein] reductase II
VQDVPTVEELTQRVMREVEEALGQVNQLAGNAVGSAPAAPEKITRIA